MGAVAFGSPVKKPITRRDIIFSAVVWAGALLVLGWRFHPSVTSWAFAGFAVLLLVVASLRHRALMPLYRAWMAIGLFLGRITTPILLTLLFFLVVVPLRVAIGIMGRDPLERRWKKNASTYFSVRRNRSSPADFERLS